MIEGFTKDFIIQKRPYFKESSWRSLSNCFKSFEEKEYLSVVIWSAIFVESLLKDFLREIGDNNRDRDEMDSLIKRVSNYIRNSDHFSVSDINSINDILRRVEEIRIKRNRLVHDTGVENVGLEFDANDVCNNVIHIITSYLKTQFSQKVYSENQKNIVAEDDKIQQNFPVFISTITPHTFEQTEFIEGFCNRLLEIGVTPVRCTLTDFDKRDPMNKVKNIIKDCNAVVVIGLERSHVYYLRDKEGSDREKEELHRRYTSAWLQIESGIAIGLDKHVFVLCQNDLYSGGIFDRDWNTFVPMELSMPLNIYDNTVNMMLAKIKEFKDSYKA